MHVLENSLIEYPFEFRKNPHEEYLEQSINLWIDDYKCLPKSLRKHYKRSYFGAVTGNLYPSATLEQIMVMGMWMLNAFAFDDFFGSYSSSELHKNCQKAIDTLNGKSLAENDEIFFIQFEKIRNKLLPLVTPYWMERFINHHELWFKGMQIDSKCSYKSTLTYPSLNDYINIREIISVGKALCDFIEISSGFMMPKEIFLHPRIQRIRQLITLIICWLNDIKGVIWEFQRGEVMNLVLVIKNERGCSIEEAYIKAVEIHNNDFNEFIEITENLPDFGEYNEGVKRYVKCGEILLKGQQTWYLKTERYSGKGEE